MNEIRTKEPKAIIRGNGKSWLAIPVTAPRGLREACYDWAVNQAGEGDLVRESNDGYRVFNLTVLDGTAGFTGDWLIRYGLTINGELDVLSISMLAEVI